MAGQWKLNGTVPTVAPGYPAVVATSSPTRFDDHGIRFNVSGRNALLSSFAYVGL